MHTIFDVALQSIPTATHLIPNAGCLLMTISSGGFMEFSNALLPINKYPG